MDFRWNSKRDIEVYIKILRKACLNHSFFLSFSQKEFSPKFSILFASQIHNFLFPEHCKVSKIN